MGRRPKNCQIDRKYTFSRVKLTSESTHVLYQINMAMAHEKLNTYQNYIILLSPRRHKEVADYGGRHNFVRHVTWNSRTYPALAIGEWDCYWVNFLGFPWVADDEFYFCTPKKVIA